jgi:hypothetical protein
MFIVYNMYNAPDGLRFICATERSKSLSEKL